MGFVIRDNQEQTYGMEKENSLLWGQTYAMQIRAGQPWSLPFNDGEDSWKWDLENSGKFTVSSLRRAINDMSLRRSGLITLWNKNHP